MSLMGDYKLSFVYDLIEKHGCKSILEIGTFAGGTAYLLSQRFPSLGITTVDLNDFDAYFRDAGNRHILSLVRSRYPEISIAEESFNEIQEIYKSRSPNVAFLDRKTAALDLSDFDLVMIDGDHSTNGLLEDLSGIQEMKQGTIVVDDAMHPHIKSVIDSFCEENCYRHQYVAPVTYMGMSGNDLCIIEIETK